MENKLQEHPVIRSSLEFKINRIFKNKQIANERRFKR